MKKSPQRFAFVLLVALSLVIWGHALIASFSLALSNGRYTHILLILPVSAALIYMERDRLPATAKPDFSAGSFCLLAAAATTIWSRAYAANHQEIALTLGMLGWVIWWFGAILFCFGKQVFRSALFPLLFLLWMVPLPAFILDRIVILLQQSSAYLTRWLFTLAFVPVSQNGFTISIPGIDLEIAQECSSIRSSLMLLVASMVLAHLFLSSPWRKALVVAAAVPLSVAKNAVRIFTLSMLATRVDPGFLTGKLHQQGGVLFFLLALGAICLLIWALRRTEGAKRFSQLRLRAAENPAREQSLR